MKLSKNLIKAFQNKWNTLNFLERQETSRMTFEDRLRESASLMRLGKALSLNLKENQEKTAVRLRWANLKKKFS